jgi:hypothetical protein
VSAGRVSRGSVLPDTSAFEVANGIIVIKASVGPGMPQAAALDTSLPVCVVSPQVAARQGLKANGEQDVRGLFGAIRMASAPPQLVRIAHVVLDDVPVCVGDLLATMSGKPPSDAPEVWLGSSALAVLSFTIDPTAQTITFRAANAPLPRKAFTVPLEFIDGRPWVNVKANGKHAFRALICTSSMGTLLPAATGKALRAPVEATFPVAHQNGKQGRVTSVVLKELAIGKAKLHDVRALYLAEGDPGGVDPTLGIIGNDILMRYRVTIDYGRRVIAFEDLPEPKPSPKPAKPKSEPGKGPPAAPGGAPAQKKPAGPARQVAPTAPQEDDQ